MDECQIPIVGIKPDVYGTLVNVFSKMIRSMELLTKTASHIGKVRPPILHFDNLFSSAFGVKVLPLALVLDNLSQVESLPFYAADDVLTLGTIAKMPDNIFKDFQYLALSVPIPLGKNEKGPEAESRDREVKL